MGMAGQSWNAAMYLLAYRHLREKRPLFSGSDLSPSAPDRKRSVPSQQ
jgi:hypothetical protein